MSDEPSRTGLEQLDPAQVGGLSDYERDAIARAIAARGPLLIRQGKTAHVVRSAFVGAAMASVAAAALLMFGTKETEAPQLAAVPLEAEPAPAPACATDAPVAPVESKSGNSRKLEIGSLMSAVASPGSELSVVTAERCNTRLSLSRGALTLRASDLRGGVLSVDTPHGEVEVKGTLFRVVIAASSTTVSVAEGAVVMKRFSAAPETVVAGQALTVSAGKMQRSELSNEEQDTLRDAFVEPSDASSPAPDAGVGKRASRPNKSGSRVAQRATVPPPSATAILAQAESLWRSGDREAARKAFRQAGKDAGTGEAAWVRLARLELTQGSVAGALSALHARKKLRGKGVLGAEAAWLEVQALQGLGRNEEALKSANNLLRDYPKAPQAEAARRLVTRGGQR